jgi:hypothetical protein
MTNLHNFPIPGELEAARATNVSLYVAQKIKAQSKKKKPPPSQKHVGLLIITNFRLYFVELEERDKNDKNNSNKVSALCSAIIPIARPHE